jgi:effector-binding domain-containing protein
MTAVVTVQTATARTLAAVRRQTTIGNIGSVWREPLDKVWSVLRSQPGLRTDGHNVFLYHHGAGREAPMTVDFGVEVTRSFEAVGEVHATQTPAGDVAQATHVGPYERLGETHLAIHRWAAENGKIFAGTSWELYADPTSDPLKLETTVCYLLHSTG